MFYTTCTHLAENCDSDNMGADEVTVKSAEIVRKAYLAGYRVVIVGESTEGYYNGFVPQAGGARFIGIHGQYFHHFDSRIGDFPKSYVSNHGYFK